MTNTSKLKKGLGRGLSSLIGDTTTTSKSNKVSISSIVSNKFQPRKVFGKEQMEELTNSIKERGIIQPIIVRRRSDASDKYEVHICKKCGLIASYNDEKHIHLCKVCDNRTDFSKVKIPYACKLMFQELMTMNIAPRIIV